MELMSEKNADPELDALTRPEPTPEILAALVELGASRAAAGDAYGALIVKAHEIKAARKMGRHQATVVACAELLDRWPAIDDREVPPEDQSTLVWALKYGCGSAMDLPEIPIATCHELVAALERALERFQKKPQAAWELRARLAFVEGDLARMAELHERIAPGISLSAHLYDHADCPGCTLLQMADRLPRDTDPEVVDAVLAPMWSKEPFPPDKPRALVFKLLYGDGRCAHAALAAPLSLAASHARHGNTAQAASWLRKGEARASNLQLEQQARLERTRIVVALAGDDRKALAEAAAKLGSVEPQLEDVNERMEAVLALHAANARIAREDALPALREAALGLARRLDGRLDRPRHVRAVEHALS
jgi:hypothetical protein